MAYIERRRNRGGSVSFLARVKVRGFTPPVKAFSSKADAAAWAGKLERELRRAKTRGDARADIAKLKVPNLIDEFLKDPDVRGGKDIENLKRLCAWWSNEHATTRTFDLGVLALRAAREKLSRGRTAATVNRYLSALRSCWNWGRSAGLIPPDRGWPTRLMLSEPAGRVRYLSDEERGRLLKAAEGDPVMHAAILLSIATGLRQGELLRLQWKDIDLDAGRLTVLLTKNSTPRAVHVPAAAVAALRALKQEKVVSTASVFLIDGGKPLRKGILEVRWDRLRGAAELKDFHWHDLRHTCASYLAQGGATLLEIGSVLGHKSPSVTMRYAHLISGAPVTGHTELNKKLT